jgi:hypothetical protein
LRLDFERQIPLLKHDIVAMRLLIKVHIIQLERRTADEVMGRKRGDVVQVIGLQCSDLTLDSQLGATFGYIVDSYEGTVHMVPITIGVVRHKADVEDNGTQRIN